MASVRLAPFLLVHERRGLHLLALAQQAHNLGVGCPVAGAARVRRFATNCRLPAREPAFEVGHPQLEGRNLLSRPFVDGPSLSLSAGPVLFPMTI